MSFQEPDLRPLCPPGKHVHTGASVVFVQSFPTDQSSGESRQLLSQQVRSFTTGNDSSGLTAVGDLERSARVIGRAYRRYLMRSGPFLDRLHLTHRLLLEDHITISVVRLTLFCLMFFLLFWASSLGVNQARELQTSSMLWGALGLSQLEQLNTVDDLTAFLQTLSQLIKVFSPSSSMRFYNPNAMQLITAERQFTFPEAMPGVQIPGVPLGDFTLMAWVMPSQSRLLSRSILRKRPQSSAGNCWGYYYPGSFKYGSHDHHDLEQGGERETVLYSPEVEVLASRSHETIVVEGTNVSFFRNGRLHNSQKLPRRITDCDGFLEVGDTDLGIGSLKFYPRAFKEHEILETFASGSTLSELATGSAPGVVTPVPFDIANAQNAQRLATLEQRISASTVVTQTSALLVAALVEPQKDPANNPLLPRDDSPTPSLPSGDANAIKSTDERAFWVGRGSPTTEAITLQWRKDTFGDYFSIFEEPVYADGNEGIIINDTFPADMDSFTVSFWLKELSQSGGFANLEFYLIDNWENYIYLETWGGWFSMWLHSAFGSVSQAEVVSSVRNGVLDESFSPGEGWTTVGAGPWVWRHLTITVDRGGVMSMFYDGELVMDSMSGTSQDSQRKWVVPPDWDFASFFSHPLRVIMYKYGFLGEVHTKLADMRIYTCALTQPEIMVLQDSSVWPSGARMKQCTRIPTGTRVTSLDYTSHILYSDSVGRDSLGHGCEFLADQIDQFPSVCASPAAVQRCKVTCGGLRKCYDGTLSMNYSPPPPPKRYRIFDRVMYLKRPEVGGQQGFICPSSKVKRAEVLSECHRRIQEGEGFGESTDYLQSLGSVWRGYDRLNLTNCDVLEQALGEGHCTWDGSWIDDFKRDFNESGRFSFRFWAKAVKESRGMPSGWQPSFHFYSRLMSPFSLADLGESQPERSKSLQFIVMPLDASNNIIWVEPTTSVDYGEWVQYYFSVEMYPGSEVIGVMCSAINSVPMSCTEGQSDGYAGILEGSTAARMRWKPMDEVGGFGLESFLEAIEFTSPLLLSPIEVSASVMTPAEVQKAFYQERKQYRNIQGPSVSEAQMLQDRKSSFQIDAGEFVPKTSLIAPPLIFQTRTSPVACKLEVASNIAESQYKLVLAAHCTVPGMCPDITSGTSVFACQGKEQQQSFFGLNTSSVGGVQGFADFLYSIADSTVLVRNDKQLLAKTFLDCQTSRVLVLAVFHEPQNGLTTVLQLKANTEGYKVDASAEFIHLSFLNNESVVDLQSTIGACFGCCILVFLFNSWILRRRWVESKTEHQPMDRTALIDAVGDAIQTVLIMVAVGTLHSHLVTSEERAARVVGNLASIPFASAEMEVSEKISRFLKGIDTLSQTLAYKSGLTTFMYFTFIFHLIRIMNYTSVHPRTGMITGTIAHGISDFAHFSLLFLIVFTFFALTATWMFGGSRYDFATVEITMKNQFQMLIGSLPDGFDNDWRLIIYVILTNIVMFFLMFNFVLAIVVESYFKVRENIALMLIEKDIVTDLVLSFMRLFQVIYLRLPTRRQVAMLLKRKNVPKKITAEHLRLAGLSARQARAYVRMYLKMDLDVVRLDHSNLRLSNDLATTRQERVPECLATIRYTHANRQERVPDGLATPRYIDGNKQEGTRTNGNKQEGTETLSDNLATDIELVSPAQRRRIPQSSSLEVLD